MGQKLLIVDDEPGIVAVVQNYFEMAGYQVITAYSGKDAIKKLSQAPDIVLLDINMPDMDGLTVCQNIREYITCPILFLTARIETTDKIKGFSISNAVRFAEQNIDVSCSLTETMLKLSVTDDGCGFPAALIKNGIQPFQKGSEDTEHFGMGLYICNLLCQRHGGSISIQNNEIGATVSATLKIL